MVRHRLLRGPPERDWFMPSAKRDDHGKKSTKPIPIPPEKRCRWPGRREAVNDTPSPVHPDVVMVPGVSCVISWDELLLDRMIRHERRSTSSSAFVYRPSGVFELDDLWDQIENTTPIINPAEKP